MAITICLNWMAIVTTFTVSLSAVSQCGRACDGSVRSQGGGRHVRKTTDLISTFERWLISLFIRAAR
jgi:hypothetical protein